TMVRPESGIKRPDLQAFLEERGVDTRTVWTGNAARQPFFKDVQFRQPPGGLPNADRVFEWGITLPSSHGLNDDDIGYVTGAVDRSDEMITENTSALLFPNLIGNVPDWDAIRAIADRHGLKVIEDSCDALGATLRGTPTGTRSDITVTSFAMAHIITCAGNGGM